MRYHLSQNDDITARLIIGQLLLGAVTYLNFWRVGRLGEILFWRRNVIFMSQKLKTNHFRNRFGTDGTLALSYTLCCHPGRHANIVTPCLLTPCLDLPESIPNCIRASDPFFLHAKQSLKTVTSLNEESRPIIALGVFPLFLPLTITAFRVPEAIFALRS